jgi:hypothetical protein
MATSLLSTKRQAAQVAGSPITSEEAFVAVLLEALGETDMNAALTTLRIANPEWTSQEAACELLADALGGGSFGNYDLSGLPTSDPGDGKPWNNGGVLCVGT